MALQHKRHQLKANIWNSFHLELNLGDFDAISKFLASVLCSRAKV
jgi:hypothetical protein